MRAAVSSHHWVTSGVHSSDGVYPRDGAESYLDHLVATHPAMRLQVGAIAMVEAQWEITETRIRQSSHTSRACSMSETVIRFIGRHAGIRRAHRHWRCTVVPVPAAYPGCVDLSIPTSIALCFSISGDAGGAHRMPAILRLICAPTRPIT